MSAATHAIRIHPSTHLRIAQQDARRGLDLALLSDYRGRLYAALCLSVLNSLEKVLR